MADSLVIFSRHGIQWGSPPGPMTLDKILYHMTPEQRELLTIKCQKQDARQADLTLQAISALVGKMFGNKGLTPSDVLDLQLGYEIPEADEEYSTEGPSEYTPTQRRTNKYGHWKMPDRELANWLLKTANKNNSADHALNLYFTDDEAAELEFCLLDGREHERSKNPFAD